jgi:hypothetical protein
MNTDVRWLSMHCEALTSRRRDTGATGIVQGMVTVVWLTAAVTLAAPLWARADGPALAAPKRASAFFPERMMGAARRNAERYPWAGEA